MKVLQVYGKATLKMVKKIHLGDAEKNSSSLMDILLQNGIPVASSCAGEGTCKKCVALIEGEVVLTCQQTLGTLFKTQDVLEVQFSYL